MGTISDAISNVWRDFVTDGIPSSGLNEVDKAEVRAIGPLIEAAIANAGLGALVSVTYATRAALNADLAHAAGTVALVYADATNANNDLYIKSGASGAGSWTLTTALHDIVAAAALAPVNAAAASASAAAASAASIAAAATAIATIPLAFTPQTGTFESGKYYSVASGAGVTSSSRDTRSISCAGGDWFLATGLVVGTDMALVTFFDAGGAYLPGTAINVGTATATAYNRFLFRAPAAARTARVAGTNNGGWPVVIESATAYPLLGDALSKLQAALSGYYPVTSAPTVGQYWSNGGTPGLVASGSRWAYASIPLAGGETVRINASVSGTAMSGIIWTDAYGRRISSVADGTASTVNYTNANGNNVFTAPANARGMLASHFTGGSVATPTIEVFGVQSGALQLLTAAINANAAAIAINAADLNNLRGYYVPTVTVEAGFYYDYATGVKTANGSRNTLRLSVTPGQQLRVNTQIIGLVTAEVVFLKADGGYLTFRNRATSNSVRDTFTNDVFTVPADAATALVCCVDTLPTVEVFGVPPISAPAISRMASVNDRWVGKRILWMGNSIPAGLSTLVGGAKGNYPAQIADLLGATVINNAIGQGIWRAGYAPRASSGGSDPLGIGGGNWVTYGRRFSASLAEMTDYVSNWGSKWRALMASDIGGLGAPPATLTTAQQTNFLSSSYENWLDPFLATTDLFVLDNPRNDVGFDYGLSSSGIMDAPVADGRDARCWYRGAMDFLIARILNYNPRANIMLFGHHETDVGPYIWQAQMLVAGGAPGWSLPICKTWEKTGFSSNVITSGGTTQAERLFAMPDGTHPHSDTTGKSLRMIAQIGASFIRDLPL